MWRRDPAQLLHGAVAGMLPKNNLRPARLRKLRVFTGPDHPFEGVELVPWAPPPRVLQDRGLGWLLPDGLEPMNPDAYVRRMRGSRLLRGAPPLTLPRGSNGADDVMAQLRKALAAQRDAGAGALLEGGIGGGTDPQLLSFNDLLTEEERAFVASSASRT
jgi:Ribosomal protein L13